MKTIKSYLLLFLLFSISMSLFSQDYYSTNDLNDTLVNSKSASENILEEETYSTESDYKEANSSATEVEVYTEDGEFERGEIYADEEKKKKKNRGVAAGMAAEIVIEVLYHAVFFVAVFWQ